MIGELPALLSRHYYGQNTISCIAILHPTNKFNGSREAQSPRQLRTQGDPKLHQKTTRNRLGIHSPVREFDGLMLASGCGLELCFQDRRILLELEIIDID